jgi:hypothetical protein
MTKSISKNLPAQEAVEEVFFKYQFRDNPETGRREVCGIELSDKTKPDSPEFMEKLELAFKEMTGSSNSRAYFIQNCLGDVVRRP